MRQVSFPTPSASGNCVGSEFAAAGRGTASEYKVSEVADRNAGIVLKINKESLQQLTPTAK